ncbi:MAG: hypothetical protein H7A30_08030 [Thermotogae bacterium]|nr:hypothetical protein [Thermotogota bacterium]
MKKRFYLIFVSVLIMILFTGCLNSFNSNSVKLTLSVTDESSKNFETNKAIDFILSLNLPLANNSLSTFRLEVSELNGIVNKEVYVSGGEGGGFQVLDNKSVKITYTPRYSGEYIFTAYYQLADNKEVFSNSITKTIMGTNNVIKNVEILSGNMKRNIEGTDADVFVVGVNEEIKIYFYLDTQDVKIVNLDFNSSEEYFQKKISKVSNFLFNISAFDKTGYYKGVANLYSIDAIKPYSTRNIDFIVSSDNLAPDINYIPSGSNTETYSDNNISVETTSKVYSVNFDISDLKDYGNDGIYSLKAYIYKDNTGEKLIFDKKYPYRYEKEKLNVILDTAYPDQIVKIVAEDYAGFISTKNYNIKINKKDAEVSLRPEYVNGDKLTEDTKNKYYLYESTTDKKVVRLVAGMSLDASYTANTIYSFSIKQNGTVLTKDGVTYSATGLTQSSYDFPYYEIDEGDNYLQLEAKALLEDGRTIVDNDSINVYLEDKTPPTISNITITVAKTGQKYSFKPDITQPGSVTYPGVSSNYYFDITFNDKSGLSFITNNVKADVTSPGNSDIETYDLTIKLDQGNSNTATVSLPKDKNLALIQGSYTITIPGEYIGNPQISDGKGNYLSDGKDYVIDFEVR